MSDQAKWTTLMVLDAAALDAGTNMHCERLQLERLALAERIAAQLRREGLLHDADAMEPPPVPISCRGPEPWVDPWTEQRADGRERPRLLRRVVGLVFGTSQGDGPIKEP
ncbi:hypothetical protein B1R94_02235 [Mycolicibacterium litorale]|nr:hypothetical protein B1R94_02235 [Mycolicibacterium litorale]